ncbi:hypothetical protein MC885_012719 [Smutsia gigantea]|nr:hypothetical protein MC885_012719 [Smutsia gigantea]
MRTVLISFLTRRPYSFLVIVVRPQWLWPQPDIGVEPSLPFFGKAVGVLLPDMSPAPTQYVPPDLCVCNFVLEQSLSVRALQEMLANTGESGSEGAAQGGGHRTLLYGHAILLRHSFSGMYLTCLTTSRSQTDKLAFDVGLREHATGKPAFPDLLLSGVSG